MSLTKSTLLAGSSLLAAGLIAVLAPVTAQAQANCTSGTAVTNNNTSAVTIAGGNPNNPGVTCTYGGSAATVTTLGSTTVSTVAPGGGINLTGGANAVNWVSTAGTVTGGVQTNGAVIEALTGAGAITLSTEGVSGFNATITHGIRAASSGGGAVSVTSTGSVSATSATGDGVTAGGTAAVEAISTGGNGAVSVTSVGASGRLYGIRAQASGTGALTINTGAGSAGADFSAGLAGIHATTDTGLLTINGTGSGGAGTGVRVSAGGDVVFTGTASGAQYGVDLANVAAGTTSTINLTSSITGTLAAIRAQGTGTVVVNVLNSQTGLNFTFTGMAAPVDVNFLDGSIWRPTPNGSTTIANGNFTINIAEAAALVAGQSGSGLETPTVLTFSGPTVSLVNEGFIVVGPDDSSTSHSTAQHESELRIVGLGEFRHAGTILMGGVGYPGKGPAIQGFKVSETDRWYDDLLVFQDGTWIGEGGNIVFDVDTNRVQASCVREATTHDFGAADCVRIVDSEVEGLTYLTIDETLPGDRGRLTQQIMDVGILLIDAPGTTVTAQNFALDPTMRGYSADSDSLDKGLFQYVLLFDEDASQFRLFGTLSGAAYQFPMAAATAQNLWRLSTGSWFDRQADLRGGIEDGIGGGVWLRVTGDRTDRDVVSVSTLGGLPYAVDNSHQVQTYAVTGGLDLISASGQDMAYVLGVMGGYAHAEVEYDAFVNTQVMDAWSGGLYAGLISGGLFVDVALSANNIILDTDNPGFRLLPEGTILSSRLVTLGAQVDAGWRFPIMENAFAEPLASVSYMRSKFDDLQIRPDDGSRPGLSVSYDDPVSLRAGIGGRVGMDQDFGVVRAQVSVLGRVWNEFEGESTIAIHNFAFPTDADILVTDDFSGQFNELGLGASVQSPGGVVSGFLNLGGKFGDDYQARTGTVGVRVAW